MNWQVSVGKSAHRHASGSRARWGKGRGKRKSAAIEAAGSKRPLRAFGENIQGGHRHGAGSLLETATLRSATKSGAKKHPRNRPQSLCLKAQRASKVVAKNGPFAACFSLGWLLGPLLCAKACSTCVRQLIDLQWGATSSIATIPLFESATCYRKVSGFQRGAFARCRNTPAQASSARSSTCSKPVAPP